MRKKTLAVACLTAVVAGMLGAPASAVRPVRPGIDDVTFEWQGIGSDGNCHSTTTVQLDPTFDKGRRVLLGYTYTDAQGVPVGPGILYGYLTQGQSTAAMDAAYSSAPECGSYYGIQVWLRYSWRGPTIDTETVLFGTPYTCLPA